MFRKLSQVSGAPKVESKYVSKYGFNNEPKFVETYKKFLKEAHVIEHSSENTATSRRIIIIQIKNLDLSVNDAELYDLFKTYGHITSHRIYMSEGGSRKHRFVCYQHDEEAARAIRKLHSMTLKQKTLSVSLAQT